MGEPKSRRRGAELEEAILEAAWAELKEAGYNRLTIEAVAARAGTSKPVIYRRWSNRAELVLAASGRQRGMHTDDTAPDTGDLRTDLLTLFTRLARGAEKMSEMIAGVLSEAFRHPEVIEVLRRRMRNSPINEALETVVGAAIARGELGELALTPRAHRLPLDLVRAESMLCGGKFTEEIIASMVDEVYLPLLRGLAVSGD